MKIWIDDIEGYLQGYAMMEQPEAIEVEVGEDFSDFFNYRWDGTKLIYDPENVPKPEPTPPTDVEVLQEQLKEIKLLNSKLMLNDLAMKQENEELKTKADGLAQINAKSMLQISELNNEVKAIKEKIEGAE
ncbi:TPA: hypothetical protein I0F89_RS00785 [Enterococcus faecalis]|nr:hypothetical protein [Enterococcus faecalis]EGS1179582.1 hypothetical protein [Enterococcus faecalis]HBI1736690.1 hypothetical protein [Enterococcus faecalis]HBI1739427.1 hypothetical protein [Enterococcus faecalis]HBI1742286.1 hypothetical protein [Enterococcus faecalis]HBI1745624.1 hypothetical protein [Enterococcus faecalis]